VLKGYNDDGEVVVRRHYELKNNDTEVKDEDGEWIPLNDIDDGGFPPGAVFTAWDEERSTGQPEMSDE